MCLYEVTDNKTNEKSYYVANDACAMKAFLSERDCSYILKHERPSIRQLAQYERQFGLQYVLPC